MDPPCPQPTTAPCTWPVGKEIPDVILLDIFMRLPARSVGRCRCLSRAWAAALAPSDDFTDRHFRAANRRPRLFVLPVPSAGVTSVPAWSPDQPRGTTLLAFPRRAMRNAGTRPCRGLIVMEEDDPPIRASDAPVYYVCNPSTGMMTALPEGRLLPPQDGGYAPRPVRCYDNLGIGYDASSAKFKVVRICRYADENFLADCDVYVVDDGFCWRPALGHRELPEEVEHISSYEASVCAQGHLYWMSEVEGPYKDEKHVISFSLSDETFGVIRQLSRRGKYGLTELEGRACLFSAVSSVHQTRYDIWLLRDDYHGDEDAGSAWDLRCRIDLGVALPDVRRFMRCLVRPLAFMDGGSRILFRPGVTQPTNDSDPVHQLCAYTPATGAMEELLADGCLIAQPTKNGCATAKAVVYEESLVSTGRAHQDILFSSRSVQALCIALHRLPASLLGRLKIVCRTWRALIETDRFIKLHNCYARTRRRNSPPRIFFPDAPSEDRRPESSLLLASPDLLDDRVVSSKPCHGLLLFTSSNSSNVHVMSPVIDECMTFWFCSDKGVTRSHGLGYDEVTEEHVLVTVVASRGSAMECQLKSLKDGALRTLQCPAGIRLWLDVPPVYVDGKMYWMGEPPNRPSQQTNIMALDIHAGAFEVLPAPCSEDMCRMVAAELAGRLCVAHPCNHTETMTIWSKKEQAWAMEHVINLRRWREFSPRKAAGLVVPVEISDGQILLDTGRAVGLYDLRKRTMNTMVSLTWRHGEQTNKFVKAALWEDSLVPLLEGGQPDRWYKDV